MTPGINNFRVKMIIIIFKKLLSSKYINDVSMTENSVEKVIFNKMISIFIIVNIVFVFSFSLTGVSIGIFAVSERVSINFKKSINMRILNIGGSNNK